MLQPRRILHGAAASSSASTGIRSDSDAMTMAPATDTTPDVVFFDNFEFCPSPTELEDAPRPHRLTARPRHILLEDAPRPTTSLRSLLSLPSPRLLTGTSRALHAQPWLIKSGFVSVGYTPQMTDMCVCRRHVDNVGPTSQQHSVKSACFVKKQENATYCWY
jgi:hypothetical protein